MSGLLSEQETTTPYVPTIDVSSSTLEPGAVYIVDANVLFLHKDRDAAVTAALRRTRINQVEVGELCDLYFTAVKNAMMTTIRHASSASWLPKSIERLQQLTALRSNWDGFGAAVIDPQALKRAEDLLVWLAEADVPPPDIFPMVDGGIRIEWHVYGLDSEVDVQPGDAKVLVYYHDLRTNTEWERVMGQAGEEIHQVRRRLQRPRHG